MQGCETDVGAPDAELTDAIRRLSRASVMVVGDVMLDRYVYGSVSRISKEAPTPVLAVKRELAMAGGAGNVVRNLTGLGAAVAFVSVVGDDQAGSDLTGLIGGQPNVEPWLLVQGSRCTTQKTRYMARGQQLLRSDREDASPVHPKLVERMLRITGDAMAATSVSVLSDYGKGVLAGGIASSIIAAARQAGRPVVVDPQGSEYERYEGADLVCPTLDELAEVMGEPVLTEAACEAAASRLRTKYGLGAVAVNRASRGLTLVDGDGVLHLPSHAAEAFEAAAANDTLVAAMAAGLAIGLPLRVAARVANLAAGVVLAQAGLAVAQEADLLAALAPQGVVPKKVVSPQLATEQVERWRRMGWRTGFAPGSDTGGLDARRGGDMRLMEQARTACDRLIVGLFHDPARDGDVPPAAVALAGLREVDLVCLYPAHSADDTLRALRPELLVEREPSPAAAMLRSWGGEILVVE